MADVREVFPILEDSSNVGAVLSKSQAGDVASGKVGLTAFGFRDSSGNLILPQLTASGKIAVDAGTAASGTCKSAYGTNAGSLTNVTLATITLTASKVVSDIEAQLSCSRAALAEVVIDPEFLNNIDLVRAELKKINPGKEEDIENFIQYFKANYTTPGLRKKGNLS